MHKKSFLTHQSIRKMVHASKRNASLTDESQRMDQVENCVGCRLRKNHKFGSPRYRRRVRKRSLIKREMIPETLRFR